MKFHSKSQHFLWGQRTPTKTMLERDDCSEIISPRAMSVVWNYPQMKARNSFLFPTLLTCMKEMYL